MSKDFTRIPLDHLTAWILKEEAEGRIFGISRSLFFDPQGSKPFSMTRFGQYLDTPIGVAAGPHTQMAQNIISAWLCGARYIELKTVQTLDRLDVSKPCIDMADEGYNCEWSQELRLEDSFDEYLNAWILVHLLKHRLGWKSDRGLGCIFNMSVGYNMEGILKDNVQRFLDRMENCEREVKEKIGSIARIYPAISQIDIPARLSNNITLSTMHGCPPDEIEKIGMYLITQRKYHTTIKLNPTLLGADHLRHILNDLLKFETRVPDEAFGHDLKYPDALSLIRNLREAARRERLSFSLKLTNTLESENHRNVFPPKEKMMYMSGRALHPISINVAAKLQEEFQGELDISFSAGADCFNLPKLIACGIKPVTVSSDVLKPGGYGRLSQYLEELEASMKAEEAGTIDQFIRKFAGDRDYDVTRSALLNLRRYAGAAPHQIAYRKEGKLGDSVKVDRPLPAFDCISAPCVNTCPAHQDIPEYLFRTAQGDFRGAYEVILRNNPFPNILGNVCDHHCQHRCTRTNFDQPVLIREVKRFIAEKNPDRSFLKPPPSNGKKVAIIGAGPSGLACAYFLVLEGFAVTVFETKAFAGGMVSDAIPGFRLQDSAIRRDIEGIRNLGVEIRYDTRIDRKSFGEIRKNHDFVYVAIGAQSAKGMGIPEESAEGVIDSLKFLSQVRRGAAPRIGPRVIIVGGGNSAMDAARTALRVIGSEGKVTVVYRRTRAEMPADADEVKALLDENIELLELTAPVSIVVSGGKASALRCDRMKLGDKGPDGRRKPVKVPGSQFDIPADTIIPAIGQDLVLDFMTADEMKTDPETGMTRLENVLAGGDAVRGPATIVKALGDGRKAAFTIMARAGLKLPTPPNPGKKGMTLAEVHRKNARKVPGLPIPEIPASERKGFVQVVRPLSEEEARSESKRCLQCNDYCGVCVTVCPNRANQSYQVTPGTFKVQRVISGVAGRAVETVRMMNLSQEFQTLNIGDFCNECGNCTSFCPTSGSPYKDKPKFYLTETSFNAEENGYFLAPGILKARVDGNLETLEERDGRFHYSARGASAVLEPSTLEIEKAELKDGGGKEFLFEHALTMGILFRSLKEVWFAR